MAYRLSRRYSPIDAPQGHEPGSDALVGIAGLAFARLVEGVLQDAAGFRLHGLTVSDGAHAQPLL
ncbi:hypothetical protein [Methylobacterium sp. WL69]|uniref:hypothetical protein n=1 Tax=Methylobacterium sp. WL69 TaxID=2603893 RepID=UPI00164F5718